MNNIKNWIIGIFAISSIVLGILYFTKKEPDIIKVPITIEVPVPGKIGTFPPVIMPEPKKEKPRPILNIPDKDKDSVLQDALTERDYDLTYKDSTQEVNVKTKVLGRLLEQEVSYNIYPDTISVDTTISVKVPVKPSLHLEGEFGYPLGQIGVGPAAKVGIRVDDLIKKKMGLKLSVDTDKRVWLGASIKL